jgi:cytochrome c biogenesis protein CcmG/thiol:disulfide interchange protein DsbE
MKLRHLVPLLAFLALMGLLWLQLGRRPAPLPSALLNRPAPGFTAPQLDPGQTPFSPQALKGQVWLLNVWSSWCASCRAEHPVLLDIHRQHNIPIVGLDYQDAPEKGAYWLQSQGNPYRWTPQDRDGRIGMDWGVYGVPETFVIDRQGRIRLRHAGPMTPEIWQGTVLPLIQSLQHG